jgi:hypothetical protein
MIEPAQNQARLGVPLAFECRLARVHVSLKIFLPGGLRRIATCPGRIDRGLDQLHLWNVTRAIGEDRSRGNTHDQLRTDGSREQRIVAADGCGPIYAQPPRFAVHGDEQ